MPRPDLSRVPEYFHRYINQVEEDDLMTAFNSNTNSFLNFLSTFPSEKYDFRYEAGKWSAKDLLQHIIDTERIFCYRALCFARKETASLPGFNENMFADNSKASAREWNSLVEEFKAVRYAAELLFRSFDAEQLESRGLSNNSPNYVLGMGFITIGHCIHHQKILAGKYL
jgi:uncharacterized damage-inducible protein DinB